MTLGYYRVWEQIPTVLVVPWITSSKQMAMEAYCLARSTATSYPEIGPAVKSLNEGTRAPWPTVARFSEVPLKFTGLTQTKFAV